MKTRIELTISLENKVDLCFEAKKTCDNNGPPYKCATVSVVRGKIVQTTNVNLNNEEQLKTHFLGNMKIARNSMI